MSRVVGVVGVACVLAALVAERRAFAAEPAPLAVVRPFAGEDDLAIYGKTVADQVAAGLRKGGVKAEVLLGEGTRGDVVVELSVVRTSGQKKLVRLEAVVRQ